MHKPDDLIPILVPTWRWMQRTESTRLPSCLPTYEAVKTRGHTGSALFMKIWLCSLGDRTSLSIKTIPSGKGFHTDKATWSTWSRLIQLRTQILLCTYFYWKLLAVPKTIFPHSPHFLTTVAQSWGMGRTFWGLHLALASSWGDTGEDTIKSAGPSCLWLSPLSKWRGQEMVGVQT